MINPHFYYSTIRKLIVAFSDLFNSIQTMDSDGNLNTVPIYFTTQSKMLFRYRQPEKAKKKVTLPVLGFVITEQSFDPERQKNKLNKIYTSDGVSASTNYNMIRQMTPFNFGFTLSLWSKYLDEFFQLLEQITVNFKPHLNTSIKLLNEDDMEVIIDVPIILESIAYDMEFNLNETEDRSLKADLNFTMKACLFPYINQNIGNIENIEININRWEDDELINKITLP
jgi:hypothetical protein